MCEPRIDQAVAAQAADLRQQALHAVQGDRRVQTELGRDVSLGPGG